MKTLGEVEHTYQFSFCFQKSHVLIGKKKKRTLLQRKMAEQFYHPTLPHSVTLTLEVTSGGNQCQQFPKFFKEEWKDYMNILLHISSDSTHAENNSVCVCLCTVYMVYILTRTYMLFFFWPGLPFTTIRCQQSEQSVHFGAGRSYCLY